MNKKMRILSAFMVLVLVSVLFLQIVPAAKASDIALEGHGTKRSPYLIQDLEDLAYFRDCVNSGTSFEGQHVRQTANIDMMQLPWTPIGTEDNAFAGVYDGYGHYVENLNVLHPESRNIRNGFFGYLEGTVANFGIESGIVDGYCSGSIAGYARGNRAAILNCYSKATVTANRAGGIVYSARDGGVIAACWFDGELIGQERASLLGSGGMAKVYHCYTREHPITVTSEVHTPTSSEAGSQLHSAGFVRAMNLSAALTQYLFANERGADLMQWELSEDGTMTFSENTGYLDLLGFINDYSLAVLLLAIILAYALAFRKAGKAQIWTRYHKDITAIAVISGVVSLFLDTAFIAKGLSYATAGNVLFTLLVNGLFLACLWMIFRNGKFPRLLRKENLPVALVTAVILILELMQFDVVPRYDGHLYYGSFQQSIDLFRIDLLTYIGAFVFWKWAHGLALLIAPLEFLMQGEMIGIYIANMVMTVLTIWSLNWLLRQICPKLSPLCAALCSAALILMPYQLGMFTYLCMDTHTALFLVWLLCCYKKKNHILIAFCGYLLAFNKITGLVFYCFFLLTMGMIELFTTAEKNLWRKILKWWDWKKILLWLTPAILYGASTLFADDLTIQVFFGSYTAATIGLKEIRGLANNFIQSFGYGFRWLMLLLWLAGIVTALIRRKKLKDVYTREGLQIFAAVIVACLSVLAVLCLYRGDAECPRYTAMFNVFYALAFPFALQCMSSRKQVHNILAAGMAVLLLVQTYWTIDPLILLTSESIDTGKKQIYKLALPGDKRPGMNLGGSYNLGLEIQGDLYSYNLEHTYQDNLLDQALTQIDPEPDTVFVTLEIGAYESHLYGNQYKIYWNSRLNHRTYDKDDPDSIFLRNQREMTTESLQKGEGLDLLDDTFYMLVAARIDPAKAIAALEGHGYQVSQEMEFENLYGSLTVYEMKLQK